MKNGHFTRKVKNKSASKDNSNQPMVTTENNVHNAWTSVKQLTNALRYFQDAVEKEIHNQLPGASSILLDIVVSCYTELGAYLINKDRNAKMLSATDRVYQSLAELMRWSDRTLIGETSSAYNREEVVSIISNLKDSVNSLVQLCVDHYQSRDGNLVKSSTSFTLMKPDDDDTFGNNNNNNNGNNENNGKTNGNTQVKPDNNDLVPYTSWKATNHSDHFSLSHHRNSLPELNPTQSKLSSSSTTSKSGTTPTTAKTCHIRHQPISLTYATMAPTTITTTATTTVLDGISSFPNVITSTYNDNQNNNLINDRQRQQQPMTINSTGFPMSTTDDIRNRISPSSATTSSNSDRFPHSLSSDSLLNSKLTDHLMINIPQNSNIYNNNNICSFNMPGGKRGGIVVANNPIQFNGNNNRNQINSFTSSFVSTSSSCSTTGCGVTDYPDLDDIPPPLPPKKKLSSEIIRNVPKRPSLVHQNSNETIQPNLKTSTFNYRSHHAMSLESFSNLMISDCNDLMTITSSTTTGQDTSHHDFHSHTHHPHLIHSSPDNVNSSQNFSSPQPSSTQIYVQQQQQSNRSAVHVLRDSRSSKDGQSLNNEDLFPLPSPLLINTDAYDYTGSGQPSPPELPVKLRRRSPHQQQQLTAPNEEIIRPPSQYDNISDVESISNGNKYDWSTWQSTNHSISCPMHLSFQAESISSNGGHSTTSTNYGCEGDGNNSDHPIYEDFTKPPPLPPKQRNITTYMTMLNNGKQYVGPDDAVLNLYRHSVHTYHLVNSASKLYFWQQLDSTFNTHLKKISSTTIESDDSILSIESSGGTSSSTANISYERNSDYDDKPPILPPKAKSQFHLQLNQSNNLYQQQFMPPPPPSTPLPSPELHHQPDLDPHPHPQPPSSSSASAVKTIPPVESGLSDQSDSMRTTDECHGPLDEVDVSSYLVYKNPDDDGPEIRGGIVDVLIVKATEVSKNDFLFQEAFLTTYRTFINPMELINKLIYRHNKFTNCTDSKQRAAKNSFALLVRVVDDLCVSDCTDLLMQILLEFIYSLVIKGDLAFARVLRGKVIEKFDNRRNGSLQVVPQILLPSLNVSAKNITLHSFKSEIVAEQMTLTDAGLFQKVEVVEYLLWAREQKEELIPNLNKFTEHFNKMSYWARSRIVEIEDPKEREKLVTKFIKIMKHLRKMNNFNSYLALLSALDSGPVRRLEWPKSITESLKDLCSLIDSSSSFRAYRQALAETQPPCIPYIGLILQDLTFVHIGNSDFLSDSAGNNINFAKRWQIFNILDQMRRFKNSHYPFKKNEQVLTFFNDFDNFLSEEAIWQISETIKPRLTNCSSNVNS